MFKWFKAIGRSQKILDLIENHLKIVKQMTEQMMNIVNNIFSIVILGCRFFEIISVILISLSANLLTKYIEHIYVPSFISFSILFMFISGIIGFYLAQYLRNCYLIGESEYIEVGGKSTRERAFQKAQNNNYI